MADEKAFKAIDPTKATKDDIAKGIELLNKEKERKHRIEIGELKGGQTWAELSPEQKKARLASGRRRNARIMLQATWAETKGYKPSEAEIDKYIVENKK